MISTLKDFILAVEKQGIGNAYTLFEFDTSEAVRNLIYTLSDPEAEEPFRSAMFNIGFLNY